MLAFCSNESLIFEHRNYRPAFMIVRITRNRVTPFVSYPLVMTSQTLIRRNT